MDTEADHKILIHIDIVLMRTYDKASMANRVIVGYHRDITPVFRRQRFHRHLFDYPRQRDYYYLAHEIDKTRHVKNFEPANRFI